VDFEYIKPLLADASGTGDGEYTDAERRADVASQFRDKFGRWVEMGRGIKGKVRLGKDRGTDAGRTARIVGKFINATPDGKFARVLVDPSDPYFGGKIVHIRNDNAEEILATLDPEYLKKRGKGKSNVARRNSFPVALTTDLYYSFMNGTQDK
jgi:hypothetical protein